MKISRVIGREIFDSRGLPTIECEIWLDSGIAVRAAAPSGTSVGSYEAVELRDSDNRLMKMGVSKAIEKLENVIAPELIGQAPEVVEMDMTMLELDGTENKSNLGANTIIATSIAIAKAQAASAEIELYELIAHLCDEQSVSIPFPLFNIINGGAHSNTSLSAQEIMIIPVGAQTFRNSYETAIVVNQTLRSMLLKMGERTCVGYEGGFAPDFSNIREVLDLISEAITKSQVASQIVFALDIAATQLYDKKTETYKWQGKKVSAEDMIEMYAKLTAEYPIYAIEDPLDENDWDNWKALTKKIGKKVQIVGDDIFATNANRIAQGVKDKIATTAIIKPNQIGTVTETLQTINFCKENGIQTVISHRSGETEDTFIVDLAVGTSAGHLKAGGCTGGQSIDKYNQLLRIEDTLMLSLLE